MPSSFFNNTTVLQYLHIVQYVFLMFTIVCSISKCPKIQQDKNLSNFVKLRCQNNRNLTIYDFLQKLKKVVRIVLYGLAISQSDCRKAGLYQLPYNNLQYKKQTRLINSLLDQGQKSKIKKNQKSKISLFMVKAL